MRKIILILCVMVFMSFSVTAAEKVISREYPWVMRSVEALGMGNAYYAKSDSKYAPFYNPAGLTRVKKWRVDLLPLTVGINQNGMDMASDVMDTDFDNNTQIANLLKKYIGDHASVNASIYPGFTKKNFTIGLYGNAQGFARPSNPMAPALDVDSVIDAGVVVGLGMSFLSDDRLQTGVSARYQYRRSYVRSFEVNDIANGALNNFGWDDMDDGSGFFVDLGVIYNLWMDGINPRFAMAVNNLGTNSLGDAKDLPYSVNVSFGISPSIGIITTDLVLDVIDVTKNFEEDNDWAKRINMGAEVRFWNRFALRTGLHQGYLTLGTGIDAGILRLNYAYYREELAAAAGMLDDERHALELVFGF